LEIGLHVLKAVDRGKGGRGKRGGISLYADQMGKGRTLIQQYVTAAEVADAAKGVSPLTDFLDYVWPLSIIHRASESDRPALVAAMLKDGWSKETTEGRVGEGTKSGPKTRRPPEREPRWPRLRGKVPFYARLRCKPNLRGTGNKLTTAACGGWRRSVFELPY
jgi:hypothetical protein